jgi:hypothetical protein
MLAHQGGLQKLVCFRRVVDYSVRHLEVSIPKTPMKGATLFRAQKVWISYVLVSIHLCMMTWAEGTNVSLKWGGWSPREASTNA